MVVLTNAASDQITAFAVWKSKAKQELKSQNEIHVKQND